MCLGLHLQQAGGVIDLLIQHWKENGFCIGNLSGIIKNDLDIKLSFVDIAAESDVMFECFPRFAFEYRDRAGLDAEATEFVQLVWPTPEGLFVESQVQPFCPQNHILRRLDKMPKVKNVSAVFVYTVSIPVSIEGEYDSIDEAMRELEDAVKLEWRTPIAFTPDDTECCNLKYDEIEESEEEPEQDSE